MERLKMGLKKAKSAIFKCLGVILCILGFFVLTSRFDFIVIDILPRYGLEYSYEWLVPYWASLNFVGVWFGFCLGFMYWLLSKRTRKDLLIFLWLIFTLALLNVGGFGDILYFELWKGGLPPSDLDWTWMSWYRIFGTWRSIHQVTLTLLTIFLIIIVWIKIFQITQKQKR